MIAGANVPGSERAFRIGHMGPEATVENVVGVLLAIENCLRDSGYETTPGQCLRGVSPEMLGYGAIDRKEAETGVSVGDQSSGLG